MDRPRKWMALKRDHLYPTVSAINIITGSSDEEEGVGSVAKPTAREGRSNGP